MWEASSDCCGLSAGSAGTRVMTLHLRFVCAFHVEMGLTWVALYRVV